MSICNSLIVNTFSFASQFCADHGRRLGSYQLMIYEDGPLSPRTIEVFRDALKLLADIEGPENQKDNVIPVKKSAGTY